MGRPHAILFAGAQKYQCLIDTSKGANLTSLMCESIETFSEKKVPKWSAQRLWDDVLFCLACNSRFACVGISYRCEDFPTRC